MAFGWTRSVSSARRFGRAVRLQKDGRLKEARDAFVALVSWLDEGGPTDSLPILSTRFMALVHLAQVAAQLGEIDLARRSLRQWQAAWAAASDQAPHLRGVAVLAKWEAWVSATLKAYESQQGPTP